MNKRTTEYELEHFLRLSNRCCEESLDELGEPLKFMTKVDALYVDLIFELGTMKPVFSALLLMNAHASLRASMRLAFSGQLLPVFMTLRGAIESALYALAMVVNPALQDVWMKRETSEEARQACRKEFTASRMFKYLEEQHNKQFADSIREAYDLSIDFGAHPNSRSIVGSLEIDSTPIEHHLVSYAYLHGLGSFELRRSLIACTETGLWLSFVVMLCFQDHPKIEDFNRRALALMDEMGVFIGHLGLNHSELNPATP